MSDLSEANDLDVSFLSHAAAVIRKASDELAEDNRKAELERKARDWKEFERLVRQFGFCNSLGVMANLAESMAEEYPEYSEEALDYEQCAAVIEAAMGGTDLRFDDELCPRSVRQKERAAKLELFKENAEGIRC